jgi:hypothetical protein
MIAGISVLSCRTPAATSRQATGNLWDQNHTSHKLAGQIPRE